MINIFDIEDNKISTDLSGYPTVFMGKTGDGKTDSLNRYLRSVAPKGKVPLFLEFEDRYKAVKNLRAIRIYSMSDLLQVVAQLKNPKAKEVYSGIVFDTADKFEDMVNKYIATNKEVEITEDIGFGKGKRYLNGQIGIIQEIRNLGFPVHFTIQLFEKSDIISKKTWYQTNLNSVTKDKIFSDAFLVGSVTLDKKAKDPLNSDRLVSFLATSEYPELKDGFAGLPKSMHVMELKDEMTKLFNQKYDADDLVNTEVMEVIEEKDKFSDVIEKGKDLGNKLMNAGYTNDAINVLKTNLGVVEEEGNRVRNFTDLIENQIDLAKVVVLELQKLVDKYGIE